MITGDEVKQISSRLALENTGMPKDDLSDEISCIVYRTELFPCGDMFITDRHIDIEYSFGEYYEIHEDTPLFSFICALCNLPLSSSVDRGMPKEQEIMIYQVQ